MEHRIQDAAFFDQHGLDSFEILHNNCLFYKDKALCGTRGWFYELDNEGTHNGKMLAREAGRLETSLQAAGDREKLCFLHYPPLYQGYECPEILRLLQRYGVKQCFYGHLHGASHKRALEGIHNGTAFSLVAGDWLDFVPKKFVNKRKTVEIPILFCYHIILHWFCYEYGPVRNGGINK